MHLCAMHFTACIEHHILAKHFKLQALQNSSLTVLPLPASSSTMICDMSIGATRPFVPAFPCHPVFTALPLLLHPGVQATQQLIWSGMKDIKTCTRTFPLVSDLRCSVTLPPHSPPSLLQAHVIRSTYIVGPLRPSGEQTYLLTCIDCFTRWPEAFPMPDITDPHIDLRMDCTFRGTIYHYHRLGKTVQVTTMAAAPSALGLQTSMHYCFIEQTAPAAHMDDIIGLIFDDVMALAYTECMGTDHRLVHKNSKG